MTAELQKIAKSLGISNIEKHIFLCCDQNKPKCCGKEESLQAWAYLKKRLEELNLSQNGHIFRSKANCLRICKNGPIAVVYPDGIWYHSCDETVLEKIIQTHLVKNRIFSENVIQK